MAIALRFNGQKFYDDLYDKLHGTLLTVLDRFFREATAGLGTAGKLDSERDGIVELLDTYIRAQCSFYADALMDSYGTGSLMDKDNQYFDEYAKSGLYNTARGESPGGPILGRGKTYVNIYGEEVETSGWNRGKNLEGRYIRDEETGELIYIEPKRPSYSIQNAEAWLMQNDRQTYMERAIEQTVVQFIDKVNKNPLDYFYYVEV